MHGLCESKCPAQVTPTPPPNAEVKSPGPGRRPRVGGHFVFVLRVNANNGVVPRGTIPHRASAVFQLEWLVPVAGPTLARKPGSSYAFGVGPAVGRVARMDPGAETLHGATGARGAIGRTAASLLAHDAEWMRDMATRVHLVGDVCRRRPFWYLDL